MLRHPFFGVVTPLEQTDAGSAQSANQPGGSMWGRRAFFGQALAAAAGGAALFLGRSSAAQEVSGTVLPAEGSSTPSRFGGQSFSTTEPSTAQPETSGSVTTQAIGEEGGRAARSRRREPIVTTQALGEEGSWYPPGRRPWYPGYPPSAPPGGMVTTYALGEEGNYYRPPPVYRPPISEPPRYTTFALGEEGGGYYRRY